MWEVVFGGRYTNSIAFRSLKSGCAGHNCLQLVLSFCFDVGIYGLVCKPCIQRDLNSSKLFSGTYRQGLFLISLKHRGFSDFPITNTGILFHKAFDAAIPVILTLLSLPPILLIKESKFISIISVL